MTTIAIFPETTGAAGYRAVAGQAHGAGRTAGEALDAVVSQLADPDAGALVIVQRRRPDAFFTAEQQRRLEGLMAKWREARDRGAGLSGPEQAELEALVEAEVRGAGERAAALARQAGL